MILETLRLEEKIRRIEGDPNAQGKDSAKLDNIGNINEIGQLKNELQQKDANLRALQRQVEGLQREYGAMGDRVSAQDNVPKKDR